MGDLGTRTLQSIGMFQDIKIKREAYLHDKAVEDYTQNMMKDPEWTPDFNDPKTDAKAFQSARLSMLDAQEKEMGVRQKKYQMIAAEAQKQQEVAKPLYQRATALGTSDLGLEAWEKLGETLMNNTDYVLDKENNVLTIKDQISGTEEKMEFGNREEMVQWFQTTASKLFDKDNFAKFAHTNYNENTAANQKAMMNGIKHVASDGTIGFAYMGIRDKFSGEVQPTMYEVQTPRGMIQVDEETWKKMNMQKADEAHEDLKRKKTEAEIGKLGAEKRAKDRDKGTTGQPHSDEKLADWYVRDGIAKNKKEAHKLIQMEKARPEKFKAYAEQIAFLDLDDPEDAAKAKTLRKELGLDTYYPETSGKGVGGGAGSPPPDRSVVMDFIRGLKKDGVSKAEALKRAKEKYPNFKF